MKTRQKAAVAFICVLFLLGAGAVAGLFKGDDPANADDTTSTTAPATTDPDPNQVPTAACAGTTYVGLAPDVQGIAFGPDAATMIDNFDGLSPEEKAVKVAEVQLKQADCQYSAMILVAGYHRGIYPWPTSTEDWLGQLDAVNNDRALHAMLVDEVVKWEADCVASMTVVYDQTAYQSDWYDRSTGTPVLVQGPGHADVRGWVIRREVKQTDECIGFRKGDPVPFTTLDERLVCFFQLATDFPLPLPPVPVPPAPPAVPESSTPPASTTAPPPSSVPPPASSAPPSSSTPPPSSVEVTTTTAPPVCGLKNHYNPVTRQCEPDLVTSTTTAAPPPTTPTTPATQPTLPPTSTADTLQPGVTPTVNDPLPTIVSDGTGGNTGVTNPPTVDTSQTPTVSYASGPTPPSP